MTNKAKLEKLNEEIIQCRKCARLVEWREEVARIKRKAYLDQEYWGRPVPGFGDPNARVVSVGLAQNMAALRALATEGIQRGHMSLHARQVAIAAGANGELIEKVAAQMVVEKVVRIDRAEEILKEYTGGKVDKETG